MEASTPMMDKKNIQTHCLNALLVVYNISVQNKPISPLSLIIYDNN